MQGDLLLASAHELSGEEAGGHGNRWGVFDDDVSAFIGHWLEKVVEKAKVSQVGLQVDRVLPSLVESGEPECISLLYTEGSQEAHPSGVMVLVHMDRGGTDRKPSNKLWSAFPFLGAGSLLEAQVEAVFLHPNRIEARLQLGLSSGPVLDAFDVSFVQSRSAYRQGEHYRFSVAALAYQMEPTPKMEHVIDDETEIRRFHARQAWADQHGCWTKDDETAAMAAWQPKSAKDLEPIRFKMDEMVALLPSSQGPEDDAAYCGQVVRVEPNALRMLDTNFWRVDAVVMREAEDVVIPIYIAERLFEGEWRPQVGEYVAGSCWLQAYPVERMSQHDEQD